MINSTPTDQCFCENYMMVTKMKVRLYFFKNIIMVQKCRVRMPLKEFDSNETYP